jgi:hypothetical protein
MTVKGGFIQAMEGELAAAWAADLKEYKGKVTWLAHSLKHSPALCMKLLEGKLAPGTLVQMDRGELKAYAANASSW